MSSHPQLVWPRTDGSKATWPSDQPAKAGGPWHEPLPESHTKYQTYAKTAGQHLADILRLPPRPNGEPHTIPLPAGYKMFVHKQPRDNGSVREDFYCFGSTTVRKLRSAQEYKDHAAWLFDTSKAIEHHSNQCFCSRGKGAKPETSASTPVKRAAKVQTAGSLPKAKKQRISSVAASDEEEVGPAGVVPERAHDLTSSRRFRRGELVWCKVTPISPPTEDLPVITHWPVLIADIRQKTLITPAVAPATLAAASAEASGSSSTAPNGNATQTMKKYYEYHLRPLGMFSRKDDIIGDIKDLLPWSLGDELLGGRPGWQSLAREGTRVLNAGIQREAEAQKETNSGVPLKERWESNWAQRIKFEEMGGSWDVAVVRMGVAIKTGISIARSWCYTDRIDIIAETALSEVDRKSVAAGTKTFYQGLWLGGERIWMEDMVRFKKSRSDLPSDLGDAGDDADNRAVFIRIRSISLDIDASNPDPKRDGWQCTIHGDIAELVPTGFSHAATWAVDETSTPLVRDYKAPKGWGFKQLNQAGSEISCDVSDIAGRVYPDLLDPSSQNLFSLPGGPVAEGRHLPGKIAQALIGLQPGSQACAASVTWQEDLFMIVDNALTEAEKSVKDYYIREFEHSAGKIPGATRKYTKKSSLETSDAAAAAGTAPAPATLNAAMAETEAAGPSSIINPADVRFRADGYFSVCTSSTSIRIGAGLDLIDDIRCSSVCARTRSLADGYCAGRTETHRRSYAVPGSDFHCVIAADLVTDTANSPHRERDGIARARD